MEQMLVIVDIFSALYLGIAFVGLISQPSKTRSSNALAWCCGVNILALLVEAHNFSKPFGILPDGVIFVLTLITYFISSVLLILFYNYCFRYVSEKTSINKWLYYVPMIILMVLIIIVLVLGFTGQIFVIENGTFIETGGYPLWITLVETVLVIYLPILAIYKRRELGMKSMLLLGLFGIIPLITLFFYLNGYADFTFAATALEFIIVYILLQNSFFFEKKIELEEQLSEIRNLNNLIETRVDIIKSIGKIFFSTYYIDLVNDTYEELSSTDKIRGTIRTIGEAQAALNLMCKELILPEFYDVAHEFVDLSTLDERLKDKNFVTCEYKGITSGWSQIYFIAGDRDENGKLLHVFSATQIIHAEKEREERQNKKIEDALLMAELANERLEKEREEERYKSSIIGSLSHAYFCIYYVDIISEQFNEIAETTLSEVHHYIGDGGDARAKFIEMSKYLVVPEQAEEVLEFTELTTVADRLKDKDAIGIHFEGPHVGWCEGMFVAADRDANGRCTHVLWAVRSIQAEKEKELKYQQRMQQALEDARRANASKAAFLSQMSHDIRTPLNGIIGLLEINEKHSDDKKLIEENRAKAKVAADHLLSLISDVLQISKLEDSNVLLAHEVFNIVDLTKDVFSIIETRAAEEGISIRKMNYDTFEFPYVCGSPLHVRQILINIFSNSIKYNKKNGTIDTFAEVVAQDDKTVTYQFTISDTGIGMSKEFLERIFEPFAQEHSDARSTYKGTGLGMSIVKSLVEKMNGKIEVSSTLGEGSTFVVTIPFEIASQAEIANANGEEIKDLTGIRVLLVEDNELNMEIAQMILEDAGIIVTNAENGRVAYDTYMENSPGAFDIVIMDLMMPEMDGFEATKAIRNSGKEDAHSIPIIAMTANAFAEDVKKCMDVGMNAHLSKPINVEMLMKTLSNMVKRG